MFLNTRGRGARHIIKTAGHMPLFFSSKIPNNPASRVTEEEFTPFRCDDIQTVFVTKSSPRIDDRYCVLASRYSVSKFPNKVQ